VPAGAGLEPSVNSAIALPDVSSTTARAIVDRFRELADADATRVAVLDRDRTTTFGQLWRMAYQRIADHRAGTATIVPILAQPTAGTIADALAVWLRGGIPLPIPFGMRAKTIDDTIARTAPVAHWCQPWRAHLHTEYGKRQIWLAGGEAPTTARLADAIGLTTGGTALIAAPLHAAAIFETAVRQLLAGGTIVLEPDFTPAGWLRTAADTHADWAVLAPGQIKALLQHRERLPGWLGVATRALRRVVVPATTTPAGPTHLADFAAAADVTVITWYHAPAYDGAATTTTSSTPPALNPLPGMRFRTVDPTGRANPPGAAGLIEAASTWCTAVAHRADQPCPPPRGWRTSGDIGTLTTAERLTVHRTVPTEHYLGPAGQRLRGTALRRTAAAHPAAAAVAVHVIPDEHGRARAQLRLWTHPDLTPPLTPAAVADYCTAQGTPVPAEHILVDTIPARRPPAGIR
jgi:hypothetical protein